MSTGSIRDEINRQITSAEEEVAKILFARFKTAIEKQGVAYAFWDSLDSRHKAAWLSLSRDFFQSQSE